MRSKQVACLITVILLSGCLNLSRAGESTIDNDWSNPAPADLSVPEKKELDERDYAEIVSSKLGTAEYWLSEKYFYKSSNEKVKFFGQINFKCSSGFEPYLIRAIYANCGTGGFTVSTSGDTLFVHHESLGHVNKVERTALIVCLNFEPKHIYNSISSAL